MAGTALKVRGLDLGPMRTEVVALFADDEAQAQALRRYVLRQQLLARSRAAEAG
jgi:hypothetical protein